MFHVIAAVICGNNRKNQQYHQDKIRKKDDEVPLRKDEKIIGRIVLFMIVFAFVLIFGVLGALLAH